jgi:Cu/Ag efflux protein CusF
VVPQAVERFASLKARRYMEGTVYAIKAPAAPSAKTGEPVLATRPGEKPGATVSRQIDSDITIKAIDPKVPSITVTTDAGHTVSFRVDDPSRIKNLKVGDAVRITYTEALIVTVDSPKTKK